MTICCNIWMICLKLNWLFYGLSRMLQFSQFVWALSYSVLVVFKNFLLIDAKDKSKISSDQKHFFIALSQIPPFIFREQFPYFSVLYISFTKSLMKHKENNRNTRNIWVKILNGNFLEFYLTQAFFMLISFS